MTTIHIAIEPDLKDQTTPQTKNKKAFENRMQLCYTIKLACVAFMKDEKEQQQA